MESNEIIQSNNIIINNYQISQFNEISNIEEKNIYDKVNDDKEIMDSILDNEIEKKFINNNESQINVNIDATLHKSEHNILNKYTKLSLIEEKNNSILEDKLENPSFRSKNLDEIKSQLNQTNSNKESDKLNSKFQSKEKSVLTFNHHDKNKKVNLISEENNESGYRFNNLINPNENYVLDYEEIFDDCIIIYLKNIAEDKIYSTITTSKKALNSTGISKHLKGNFTNILKDVKKNKNFDIKILIENKQLELSFKVLVEILDIKDNFCFILNCNESNFQDGENPQKEIFNNSITVDLINLQQQLNDKDTKLNILLSHILISNDMQIELNKISDESRQLELKELKETFEKEKLQLIAENDILKEKILELEQIYLCTEENKSKVYEIDKQQPMKLKKSFSYEVVSVTNLILNCSNSCDI